MAAEVWSIISSCRAVFGNGGVAVSAPPRHSRLCMTIQQIEQLSATRSQREGGQRLGSADAAPWQYHPEVASLANTQQLTRRLESSKQLLVRRKDEAMHSLWILLKKDEAMHSVPIAEMLNPAAKCSGPYCF